VNAVFGGGERSKGCYVQRFGFACLDRRLAIACSLGCSIGALAVRYTVGYVT